MQPLTPLLTLCVRLARALLTTCIVSAALPAFAQTRPDEPTSRVPAHVTAAHLFVMAAYPDLFSRATALTIRRIDSAIVVEVAEAPVGQGREATDRARLLTATVTFDAAGRLQTYAATGSFLDEARNRALHADVATHPEWSDTDKDAWLRASGGPATSGPHAPALAALSDASFQRTLGQDIVTALPTFRWKGASTTAKGETLAVASPSAATHASDMKGPVPPRPALAVTPAWVVDAVADTLSATPLRYRLEYEPFGGRLIAVVRQ